MSPQQALACPLPGSEQSLRGCPVQVMTAGACLGWMAVSRSASGA